MTCPSVCFRQGHLLNYEPNLRKIEKVPSSLAEVERVLHPVVAELTSRS